MTPLQRYPAKDIASDHVGRLFTRREAVRRLALLGVSAAAASALFAACGNERASKTAGAGADAFVDFTTKPDGDPPAVLDSGQAVNYALPPPSNWKPQIAGGTLVHGTPPPGAGAYADYYQAQLDRECRAFGARWTVDSNDGSTTDGVMCFAAWAGVFGGSGTTVPKTAGHITITTITGAWAWWVSDGDGTGSNHLKAVKTGTFSPPASDARTVWETAAYIDRDSGIGYLYLPGNDATTGTQYVTVTDAEIAGALVAQGVPATTFAATQKDADVLMVEHYANSAADTARYPRFLSMWGDYTRAIRQISTTPPPAPADAGTSPASSPS